MDDILTRILEGNNLAVETFYLQNQKKITKYLERRLPVDVDIEAFTNDIFLETIDSLPIFRKECSLLSWLYRIAHNKIVDYYRKKKIKTLLLSQMPFLEIIAKEVYQPEFQYEKNKIRDAIEVTLRGMSEKYRQILKLHYEDNKSVKEIAVTMNLSFKATESLLFRARQDFKKNYERE